MAELQENPVILPEAPVVEPAAELSLTEKLLTLASKLRTAGYVQQAENLENRFGTYKKAEVDANLLYRAHSETGDELLESAHPDGDVEMAPAQDNNGDVETGPSQHKKILKVVLKSAQLAGTIKNIIIAQKFQALADALNNKIVSNKGDANSPDKKKSSVYLYMVRLHDMAKRIVENFNNPDESQRITAFSVLKQFIIGPQFRIDSIEDVDAYIDSIMQMVNSTPSTKKAEIVSMLKKTLNVKTAAPWPPVPSALPGVVPELVAPGTAAGAAATAPAAIPGAIAAPAAATAPASGGLLSFLANPLVIAGVAAAIAGSVGGYMLFDRFYSIQDFQKAGQQVLLECEDVKGDLSAAEYKNVDDLKGILPNILKGINAKDEFKKSPSAENYIAIVSLKRNLNAAHKATFKIWDAAKKHKEQSMYGTRFLSGHADVELAANNFMELCRKASEIIDSSLKEIDSEIDRISKEKLNAAGGAEVDSLLKKYKETENLINKYESAIKAQKLAEGPKMISWLEDTKKHLASELKEFSELPSSADKASNVKIYADRLNNEIILPVTAFKKAKLPNV
jgi:hypothetical protein